MPREKFSKSAAESRQLSQRSIHAIERGQWTAAEAYSAEAVKMSPKDPLAHRQYAEALWYRQAWPEAIHHMETAHQLAPHDPATSVRLGEMYLQVGRIDDTWEVSQKAIDYGPRMASAWVLRAEVHRTRGELEEALAYMHRALSYEPDQQELLLETAELYRYLDRPARALCTLQNLKETYSPGEEPARVLFLEGLAFAGLGRFDDATESLKAAVQRDPNHVEGHYRLGEIHMLAGRTLEAQLAVQKALTLHPQHIASQTLSQRLATQQPSVPAGNQTLIR